MDQAFSPLLAGGSLTQILGTKDEFLPLSETACGRTWLDDAFLPVFLASAKGRFGEAGLG
jgi:hypothetical protein